MRKRRFNYPVELVQPKSGNVLWLFDDFAEVDRPSNLFIENQRYWKIVSSVMTQNRNAGNQIHGRSQEAF
jgi:hypothetical protein